MKNIAFAAAMMLAAASPAYAVDNFQVTFEAAKVQNTTRTVFGKLVETFTGRAATNATFTNVLNPTFSVSYNTIATLANDANGGAGPVAGNTGGRYMRVAGGTSETITINQTAGRGTNYFGMYVSAFDPGNFVDFRRGGNTVFTFSPANLLAAVGACPNVNNAYCGNPRGGSVPAEPFVFINFVNKTSFFDEVVIRQASPINANAGYQTDNHTFGAVPEPATWLMLIAGFGMVGVTARRRNTAVAA
ncbi:PEPxxWA-CTERM sorting domain-containing protein [Sandarakinorhabdus sp.]|uniref:Npun_F0296 family exosortase-dependent surface protein n=1 Tax=Sandarakinorhabdus sp. TaxID=1916663 RepID=UPI00333F64FF